MASLMTVESEFCKLSVHERKVVPGSNRWETTAGGGRAFDALKPQSSVTSRRVPLSSEQDLIISQ